MAGPHLTFDDGVGDERSGPSKTIHDHPCGNSNPRYREICAFLDELTAQDPFRIWESGQMSFWRCNVHAEKDPADPFFAENVRVWRAEGDGVVGLAISEYGKDDLSVETFSDHRDVVCPRVFHRIDEIWAKTRDAVQIEAFADDAEKIRRLKDQRYAFDRYFENLRIYNLDAIDLSYALEDGFTIRTFAEAVNVEERVALVRSAFDNPNYSEERLAGLISSPDHIEPVGTHADYRRRGFATAVIRECFVRLKRDGIRTVDIASQAEPAAASFLYDSLKPTAKREAHRHRKTLG